MTDQPLGRAARLFLVLYGAGFLILFGGFIFIVAKLVKG